MFKQICFGMRRGIISNTMRSPNYPIVANRKRNFSDDIDLPIGGGLEKLQGSFKEESYFQSRNYNLLKNIRDHGAELSCDSSLGDWREFEKASSKTSLSGTCSLNRHKNCLEEAFFVNEQTECSQLIKEKICRDSKETEAIESQGRN